MGDGPGVAPCTRWRARFHAARAARRRVSSGQAPFTQGTLCVPPYFPRALCALATGKDAS